MNEEIIEKDIVQDSIKCLANAKLNNTTYEIARDIVLGYITNLQERIDKATKYIEKKFLPSHSIEKTDWEFEEVIYSDLPVTAIKPLVDILQGNDKNEK